MVLGPLGNQGTSSWGPDWLQKSSRKCKHPECEEIMPQISNVTMHNLWEPHVNVGYMRNKGWAHCSYHSTDTSLSQVWDNFYTGFRHCYGLPGDPLKHWLYHFMQSILSTFHWYIRHLVSGMSITWGLSPLTGSRLKPLWISWYSSTGPMLPYSSLREVMEKMVQNKSHFR